MALLVACLADLCPLPLPRGADLRPGLHPTVITHRIAQSQHRIDMLACPVHPCPFQARFDHELVAAFYGATADRPSLGQVDRVLHLCLPFFQVLQVACQLGEVRVLCGEDAQLGQHDSWPLLL